MLLLMNSPAYQAGLWLLFIAVAVGWSWYFHVPALARQVGMLPAINVLIVQRGPYRVRAITVQGKHRGLRLVTYGLLKRGRPGGRFARVNVQS